MKASKSESVITSVAGGETYNVVARGTPASIGSTDGAYALEGNIYVPDLAESKSPGSTIKSDGTRQSSSVNVSSCSQVTRVVVETDISYTFRKGLSAWLTNPAGTTVKIWNEGGGFSSNLVGTFPFTLTPANPLSGLTGGSGNGTWTLDVAATAGFPFTGTLNRWALQLNCN